MSNLPTNSYNSLTGLTFYVEYLRVHFENFKTNVLEIIELCFIKTL